MVRLCFFILGCCWVGSFVLAQPEPFWAPHAKGWHWYVDPAPQHESSTPKPMTPQKLQTLTPAEQLKQLQTIVQNAKAEAVLNPTPDNVMRYIILQNVITQNASRFSRTWAKIIWQHPSLNYQLVHPTNQAAQSAYKTAQSKDEDKILKQAAQHLGLFFFFEGRCPYCQRFAPTVKQVAATYGFSVLPISIDGLPLPDYPHPVKNQGQAQAFKVTRWPALFLVEPNQRVVIPVTFGMISVDELKSRLTHLIKEARKRGKVSY